MWYTVVSEGYFSALTVGLLKIEVSLGLYFLLDNLYNLLRSENFADLAEILQFRTRVSTYLSHLSGYNKRQYAC
jgi:hypothetical protein